MNNVSFDWGPITIENTVKSIEKFRIRNYCSPPLEASHIYLN